MFMPEGTIVNVQAQDKEWAQLVLSVKEAVVDFEESLGRYNEKRWNIHKNDPRWKPGEEGWINSIVTHNRHKREAYFKRDGEWFVKNKTTGSTRYFLLGRDERQLFMCQLKKNATSVRQAHDGLKAPTVILAEGKQRDRTIRQGEWFFLNPSEAELQNIATLLKQNKIFIKKKTRLPGLGKPHVADEYVEVVGEALEHGYRIRGRNEIFVRGKIRHSDHETVTFQHWRKVIRNNEETAHATVGGSVAGGTWID
jgi:hypothetical protein